MERRRESGSVDLSSPKEDKKLSPSKSPVRNETDPRFQTKDDHTEISKKIKDQLLHSERELRKTQGEVGLEEPSKLDYLWDLCEGSTERTKLVLADSLEVPFYLPPKKNFFGQTPEQIAREQKRVEYLIKRDLKEMVPHRAKTLEAVLPPSLKLTPREQ
jgi:hypothetical protein